MLKLIEDEKPDMLIVATDSKEKTFRHDLYPEYKANRTEMPKDLADQLPYFFQMFSAMGIPVLRQPGMEADDLIGSVCRKFANDHIHCFIVSGDKDFMQLIGPSVYLYAPKKNEPAMVVSYDGVMQKFGCKPDQVIDVLALIGDASDNVPGVHGIGDKGAAKLIHEFGSLDSIYQNLEKISNLKLRNALQQDRGNAYLSRDLVTIKTDIELDVSEDELRVNSDAVANEKLLDLFTTLEFRQLTTKVKDKIAASTPAASKVAHIRFDSDTPLTEAKLTTPSSSRDKFGNDYILANSAELVLKVVQHLKDSPTFSFDTETTGLDRISDTPIGVSFAIKSGGAWYIPLTAKHLTGWVTPDFIKDQLRPIFSDHTKTKIAHNLKFDIQMLQNIGIKVAGPWGDTMLASYVMNPVSRDHSLDFCALSELHFKKIATSSLMGPKFQTSMLDVPLEELATYACEDADIVFQLHEHFIKALQDNDLYGVYSTIEVPLAPILGKMERTGVHIDANALAEISSKLDLRVKDLEQTIYKEAGETFNINSTKQLQHILFDKLAIHTKLGITRLKKTKTGYSTDVSVLEAMDEHPLPRALLEYRTVTKLKNTYVDALPQLINPKTERIHTSFHQTGTATGRLSSSDPNLQNIPIRKDEGREIRKAFTASAPDRVIVSADYSQIELRLLAHIADDSGLKAAFASGLDVHTATACRIFGVTPEKVTTDLRANAKAINFGIIYGMGPQRLARQTGVSMSEAKLFIEKYFEGFPNIRKYIEQAKAKSRETGYSWTMTGRRRPIPEIHSKERLVMINGENMAVNSPIQGSAADLIKLAMIEIQRRLDESSMDAVMLLQVHDELVFECNIAVKDPLIKLVRDAMEHAMTLSVPLKVEAGAGSNWLEAH